MSFHLGDKLWLHLDNKCFKGQYHKLLPIRYGPYTILEKIGENSYQLDLSPQFRIHNVFNFNHLNFFEPPLLEEPVTITHPMENISDFQLPLSLKPGIVIQGTEPTPPTLWHAKDKL